MASTTVNIEAITESVEKLMQDPKSYQNDSYLEGIKKALNREFSEFKCIAVIVGHKPTRKNQTFGARVYPTQNEMDVISKEIIDLNNVSRYKVKEYIIELDYAFMYNKEIALLPEEMTAIILHEVGHVKNFSQEIANAKLKLRNAYTTITVGTIGSVATIAGVIPLPVYLVGMITLELCQSVIERNRYIKGEIVADSMAIEYGLGGSLKKALEKAYDMQDGPALKNNKLYQWIVNVKTGRQDRLNELDRYLQAEINTTNSPIIKGILVNIQMTHKRSLKGSALGANLTEAQNLLNESIRSFAEMIKTGHSMLEIEEIRVEIQRMSSYEDKMYIVTRIAKDRSKAEYHLSRLPENDVHSRKKINEFLKELDELSGLLRKANPERQYGIIIKAPVGYEG